MDVVGEHEEPDDQASQSCDHDAGRGSIVRTSEEEMRLTLPELLLVWLAALACGVVAVGALAEFGTNRAGTGIAVMCAVFAYGLVRRHVMAVLLSLVVAVIGLIVAILCVIDGPISYGLIGGASTTLYLLVVGRAALRELTPRP